MCIIVFSLLEKASFPFILVSNRDEFFNRPAEPAHFWEDLPFILAGRDNSKGGTWLGVTKSGRFAAVTNYRRPKDFKEIKDKSRGDLVTDFLNSDETPLDYVHRVTKDKHLYNGFNLLVADLKNLKSSGVCWFSNLTDFPVQLSPHQLYGVSNSLLDTPWPKLLKAKERLQNYVSQIEEKIIHQEKQTQDNQHTKNNKPSEEKEHKNHQSQSNENTLPEDHQKNEKGESIENNDIDWKYLFSVLNSDKTYSTEEGRPNTGIGEPLETFLSAIFVNTPPQFNYGTRCTTIVILDNNCNLTFIERSFNEKRDFDDVSYSFKLE